MRLPARLPSSTGNLPAYDPGYVQLAPMAPQQPQSDLGDILRKVWRRKGMVALTAIACIALAAFLSSQMQERYSASATVMIGVPEAKVVKLDSVLAGISADAETVQNESYVLQSRELAQKVVDRLALDRDPEFNLELREYSNWRMYLDPRYYIPESVQAWLTGPENEAEIMPTQVDLEEQSRQRVISVLLSKVEVAPLGRSHVLSVNVTSEHPVTAAKVANTLAQAYIDQQLERKTEATERASGWLDDRIAELRQQVETAERAVEEYRKRNNLFESGRDSTVTAQQLTELNTQLILAQTEKAEAEVRLSQAQELLRSSNTDTAPEVLRSPLILALKQQQAEVERKAAELAATYGDKHPRMVNARAEIRDVQQKIKVEIGRVIEGLRNEAAAADARYRTLRSNLDRIKVDMADSNESSIRLRQLEREAAASRTLYENFLSRSKETSAQQDMQQADARIISHAAVPEVPSFPPTGLIVFLGAIGGSLLGLLMALLVEHLDRTFRSGEQVEEMTGLPTLALVPLLGRRTSPAAHVLKQPSSPYSEALRKLHAGLMLSDMVRPPKVVMFASAAPNEGKSGLCISMARLMAKSGRRVILVDCDWRRPHLHRMFNQSVTPGLAELLSGHATPEEVVYHDVASGADVIFAGRMKPEQSNLLAADQMRMLLHSLSQHYDMVIVDTPPVLVGAEVLHLSQIVDQTVFVVRWGHTRREVALSGLKQLLEAQGKVAGVVLSQVHPRRYKRYGYGQLSYQYVRPASARVG